MGSKIDIVGRRFGRWTVLRDIASDDKDRRVWCRCDCGQERSVMAGSLRKGVSNSCGCLKLEKLWTHGASGGGTRHRKAERWYKAWSNMIDRCYNPNYEGWHNYGGRGVIVCDRWRNDPLAFRKDMGDPTRGKSLDRIDVNGIYSSENCRWASHQRQCWNKRTNVMVDFHGHHVCLAEAAKMAGLRYSVVWQRVHNGWSTHDALNVPVGCKP